MPTFAPYIHVSPLMEARVDLEPLRPRAGIITQTVLGHHAIWAATVPYIPAVIGQAVNAFSPTGDNRASWLLKRQLQLLHGLTQITNHQATFELRYVVDPRPGTHARVTPVFLGKSFAHDPKTAREIAQLQWERVSALFPSEPPFYYPFVPVIEEADPPGTPDTEASGFSHWFEPVSDSELNSGLWRLIELRKHEDWPRLPIIGKAHFDVDYIPHPFVPPVEYASMARLLEALARLDQRAFVAITLRPQPLTAREDLLLAKIADWYDKAARGELINMNPAVEEQRRQGNFDYDAEFRRRAEFGQRVYTQLARDRAALLLYGIRIVAGAGDLASLKEAVGSELITNTSGSYQCQYDVCIPQPGAEHQLARFNMRWLELERWAISPLLVLPSQERPDVMHVADSGRLRFFVTASEALALFRLPADGADAHLHGMEVRDEPFTAVPIDSPRPDDLTGLGDATVAGVTLPIPYRVPRSSLAGGLCVIGDDRPQRAVAARRLATWLASQEIPSVILGPAESPMYVALHEALDAHPAHPSGSASGLLPAPGGTTLAGWSDAIVHALALAFDLPTNACPMLKIAIDRAVDNAHQEHELCLDDVIAAINETVSQASGESAPLRAIRERCLPELRALATHRGAARIAPLHVLGGPVAASATSSGTGLEPLDAALACAGALVALVEVARASTVASPPAILVLIEPERLLPRSRSGDQPLLPLLDRLRQSGGALITFTARPQRIDLEALTSGVMAVYQTTNHDVRASCRELMHLTEREVLRLDRLSEEEAVWHRQNSSVLVRLARNAQAALAAPHGEGR